MEPMYVFATYFFYLSSILTASSQVPSVSSFSSDERLNGEFILKLKAQWKCQRHHGEHGQPGYCYITPAGKCIPLNNHRFDAWAAAWVSLFAVDFCTMLTINPS